MGLWKWPSIALVLFCLALIVPYAKRAGGADHLGTDFQTLSVGACAVDFRQVEREASTVVRARISPGCAARMRPPVIALIDERGEAVVQAGFRGGPNSLVARLASPGAGEAARLQPAMILTPAEGPPLRVILPEPPSADAAEIDR